MKLIGIAGQARAGKDTSADYLAEKLGWARSAFASNVKKIFCEAFSAHPEFIETWKTRNEIPEGFGTPVRKALQFIGDGFRQIKDSVWVDMLLKDISSPTIISDIRYVNELRAVKERGGKTVLVYRPGFLNDDPNDSEAVMRRFVSHFLDLGQEGLVNSTEEYGLVDFFIINDGSVSSLHSKIDSLVLPHLFGQVRAKSFSR